MRLLLCFLLLAIPASGAEPVARPRPWTDAPHPRSILPTNPPPCTNCPLPGPSLPYSSIPWFYPNTNCLAYYDSPNAYCRSNEAKWYLENFGNVSRVYNWCGALQEQFPPENPGGADLDIVNAWAVQPHASNVTVAIVDAGVWPHPDLTNQFSTNGTLGSDLHATAVAGMLAAAAPQVRILSVVTDYSESSVANGINEAVDKGARIINLSLGFLNPLSEPTNVRVAIQRAASSNVLVIAAAMNGNGDQDTSDDYPANWHEPNVLMVGGHTRDDQWYSYVGATNLHLAAPARLLVTLDRGRAVYKSCSGEWFTNFYCYFSGTSGAVPLAAGVAALCLQLHGENTAALKTRLLKGAFPVPEFAGKCVTGARLHAYRSLIWNVPRLTISPDGVFASVPEGANLDVICTTNLAPPVFWELFASVTGDGFPHKIADLTNGPTRFFTGNYNTP